MYCSHIHKYLHKHTQTHTAHTQHTHTHTLAHHAPTGEDTKFLLSLGLSDSKAKETLQNAELTVDLKAFVAKVGGLPLDKATANLVYDVAARYRSSAGTALHVDFLLEHLRCVY